MEFLLDEILKNFEMAGSLFKIQPVELGHIHDTFLVTCQSDPGGQGYILQRINRNVFKDPCALMENVIRVTDHIHRKMKSQPAVDLGRGVRCGASHW